MQTIAASKLVEELPNYKVNNYQLYLDFIGDSAHASPAAHADGMSAWGLLDAPAAERAELGRLLPRDEGVAIRPPLRARQRGRTRRQALLYAGFLTLGKLPEAQGLLRYHLGRLRGARSEAPRERSLT